MSYHPIEIGKQSATSSRIACCCSSLIAVWTAGIEPAPPEWRSGTLPLSHVREGSDRSAAAVMPSRRAAAVRPSWSWWVGMELNHHSRCGAFTAPWARQCPAYPSVAARERWLRELAEGEGVEPSTQRSARLSRPVAHRCAPPSVNVKWSGRLDSNQRPPASKAGALAWLSYTLCRETGAP